ncbi:hypothetical protein [Bombella mellum]|uniref:HEPN AbiU2-like domain-containing protein n=1 Tax=Bombella mellum TaxID=2039288 RepID=A0ABR5ZRG0_9PROT|nr:hypothetical protein [Bombella mellum]MBA5726903.1 hypothetical protein [Bombella mellum]
MCDITQEIKEQINNLERYVAIRSRLLRIYYCIERISNILDDIGESFDKCKYEELQEYFSLNDAFIISYGAIFNSSLAAKHVSFDDKIFDDDIELKNIHKDIMQQRNKIVAHHDFRDKEEVTGSGFYIKSLVECKVDENTVKLTTSMAFDKNSIFVTKERVRKYKEIYNKIMAYRDKKERKILDKIEKITNKKVIVNGDI